MRRMRSSSNKAVMGAENPSDFFFFCLRFLSSSTFCSLSAFHYLMKLDTKSEIVLVMDATRGRRG